MFASLGKPADDKPRLSQKSPVGEVVGVSRLTAAVHGNDGKTGGGNHVGPDFIFIFIDVFGNAQGNFVFVFPNVFAAFVESDDAVRHLFVAAFKNLVGAGSRLLPLIAQRFALIFQLGKTPIDSVGDFFDIVFILGQPLFRLSRHFGAIADGAFDADRQFFRARFADIGNLFLYFLGSGGKQNFCLFVGLFSVAGIFLVHFPVDFGRFGNKKALQKRQIDFFVQGFPVNGFFGFRISRVHKLFGRRRFRAAGAAELAVGFQLGRGNDLRDHFVTLFAFHGFAYFFTVFADGLIQFDFFQPFAGIGKSRIFFVQRIGCRTQFLHRFGRRRQTGIQTHIQLYFGFDVLKQPGKFGAVLFLSV